MSNYTNFLFMFYFDNEDDDRLESGECDSVGNVYVLIITTDEPERLISYFDGSGNNSEKFYRFISINEEDYGIHDVGFLPDYYVMGYSSYEIEKKDHITVMNNISIFLNQEGFSNQVSSEGEFKDFDYNDEINIAKKYLSQSDLNMLKSLR